MNGGTKSRFCCADVDGGSGSRSRGVLMPIRCDACHGRREMDRGSGSGNISCQHGVVIRRTWEEEGEGSGKKMEKEDYSNLTKKILSDHH